MRRNTRPESPWALLAVIAIVLIGAIVIAAGHWRRGAVIIGGAMGIGAILRLVLPNWLAGLLVVRSRWVDVLCLSALTIAILVVSLFVPASAPR